MALTFGFYNSVNNDREYDAVQMSSIFDGIIRDGIFMHIGTSMMVRTSSGMTVTVGVGRAWFNHTWTLNDALYPITIAQSEVVQDRIDTIVLEVDSTLPVRANSFKVIKGTPSAIPVRPALVRTTLVNQYPLCDIRVNRGVTVINQANISNRVGLADCPFVTGPLTIMNIDSLVAQWGDQWLQFYNAQVKEMTETNALWKSQWSMFYDYQVEYVLRTTEALLLTWHEFYEENTAEIAGQNEFWRQQWIAWYNAETTNATTEMVNWRNDRQAAWDEWFASLEAMLDGNVEANMAAAILDLQNRMIIVEDFKHTLSNDFKVLHNLQDSDANNILDSIGREIEGQIIFQIR